MYNCLQSLHALQPAVVGRNSCRRAPIGSPCTGDASTDAAAEEGATSTTKAPSGSVTVGTDPETATAGAKVAIAVAVAEDSVCAGTAGMGVTAEKDTDIFTAEAHSGNATMSAGPVPVTAGPTLKLQLLPP